MLNENKQIQEPPPVSSLALFWGLYFVTLLAASLCLIQLGVSVPSSQLSD